MTSAACGCILPKSFSRSWGIRPTQRPSQHSRRAAMTANSWRKSEHRMGSCAWMTSDFCPFCRAQTQRSKASSKSSRKHLMLWRWLSSKHGSRSCARSRRCLRSTKPRCRHLMPESKQISELSSLVRLTSSKQLRRPTWKPTPR